MTSFASQKLYEELKQVDLDAIEMNPNQPRRRFSPEELEELAASIRAVGIIHPPVVCRKDNGGYELIAGERRCRAARLASLKQIPVLVRAKMGPTSAEEALVENVQRVDLNPLEIANALKNLGARLSLSQEALADRIGKKRSTVANYLRLLALPEAIQESVSCGLITMGHAKVILSLEGEKRRLLLHEIVLRDGLTVRAAEKVAESMKNKRTEYPQSRRVDDIPCDLVDALQYRLGTKVRVEPNGKAGKIIIDYYSLDDLDRLCAIFGIVESEIQS